MQTETLETTLQLLHRSRLEIEKAQALLNQTSLAQPLSAGASRQNSPPISPRRKAFVRHLVERIISKAVGEAGEQTTYVKPQSRLEREKVREHAAMCH